MKEWRCVCVCVHVCVRVHVCVCVLKSFCQSRFCLKIFSELLLLLQLNWVWSCIIISGSVVWKDWIAIFKVRSGRNTIFILQGNYLCSLSRSQTKVQLLNNNKTTCPIFQTWFDGTSYWVAILKVNTEYNSHPILGLCL